jgi:hypothetical protein
MAQCFQQIAVGEKTVIEVYAREEFSVERSNPQELSELLVRQNLPQYSE